MVLTKGYWMRNNQNRGFKWNGNLYNINKIQYSQTSWKNVPTAGGDNIVSKITHPHKSVQRIYEEWVIPITDPR